MIPYAFFGTPKFAKIVLRGLIDAGLPPSALVCNPDRPVGRKKVITPPPTKKLIIDNQLPVTIYQPESKEELVRVSDKIFQNADFGIVAAYSTIIPKTVIERAKWGIIGVHPSLLPKLRGASPIQSAILEGEEKTGVTLFMIDDLVDNGPVLKSKRHKISNRDTYESLEEDLAKAGAELLVEILPSFAKSDIPTEIQDKTLVTFTKKFETKDGYVMSDDLKNAEKDGHKELAESISRKIRALNPEPGVYTVMGDVRTKLLKARLKGNKLILERIQKSGGTPIDL